MSTDDKNIRPGEPGDKEPQSDTGPKGYSGLGLTPQPGPDPEEPRKKETRKLPRAWIVAGCAVVLVLVVLAVMLPQREDAPRKSQVTMATTPPPASVPAEAPENLAPAPGGELPYEETLGVPLERMVRQIDYALIETLLFTGYDPHAMTIREMRLETYHDEPYHFQILDIELEGGPKRFVDILGRSLTKWAPEAHLKMTEEGIYEVAVAGRVTHRLEFAMTEPRPSEAAPGGLMALVIDDMGQDIRTARNLAALPFPVTFAVLPGTPHAREVAALARETGHELLLHLPMEPKGWPGINPGPGALFTTMDAATIREVLIADLAKVPGVVGVNNHMGSRFTGDAAKMAVVMEELKTQGLFFLDSLTAKDSTAVTQAKAWKLPVYRRNIFLDNIRDVSAITRQLERAERVASITGQAVTIGHPYPETLEALKKWGERSDRHARIVPVGKLNPLP